MKHALTISQILSLFHESWMSIVERKQMDEDVLASIGKTMEQLNSEIEEGIRNGYSVEQQLSIILEHMRRES